MIHIAQGVYRLLVWLTVAVIGWCESAGIPSLPDTYGRAFFLPYIDYSPWLLTINIVPTFHEYSNFTITITDHQTGRRAEWEMVKYGRVTLNYTDIINNYDLTEYSGTHINSPEDISIYIKMRKGDMMTVFPMDALDHEYFIPQRSSPLDYSLVFVFASSNNTTVTTNCNLTDTMSNVSHGQYGDQTSYPINAFETLKLETSNGNTIRVKADKPVGVILLTVDVLYDTENSSFEDSNLVYFEFVPPRCTWGKLFYAVSFFEHGSLTFTISAELETNITLKTHDSIVNAIVGANMTEHYLCANVSYVTLTASSPVQVYVIQTNEKSHLGCRSSYFLPPIEQYLRCLRTCKELLCPSFLPLSLADFHPSISDSVIFSDANSPTNCTVATYANIGVHKSTVKTIEIDNIYMVFLQDGAAGSVIPLGSRLSRIHGACVQTIVANGGAGDGVDNDCDGFVDEETLDMKDDDGDSRVDEDTRMVCNETETSRKLRSKEVDKSVTNVFFSGVDYVDEEDSQKPLIAVIVSLCVSIFAVFAVISIFMLLELLSRRNQLRNTKIRPFVS
ncbi:uncharacterized protein [Haliotis asinina]|uniref:uncharacterized protein n=1 Tax=Haliotis asinina TaxID=109174 RepID=UPI0035325A66